MNFCSHCGSKQLLWEIPKGDNRERYVCQDCGTIHYQNPKIVAGCIVTWEGKILLGKRDIEPRRGFWNIPAGFLELGETPREGAIRETREEMLAQVELQRLHSVYSINHVGQVYMIFLATLKAANSFGSGQETTDVRLFAPNELPFEDLAFSSNHFAITRYLENPDFKGVHHGVFVTNDPKT
ncbi:MAG: NUDIX hydrolase [Bacteroidota bacterium]